MSEATDTSFYSSSGVKFKTELRYYLNKTEKSRINSALQGIYIATNAFNIRDFHNSYVQYSSKEDSTQILDDGFGVKKIVWGGNFIFGVQIPLNNKLMCDFYFGHGIRYRDVSNIYLSYDPASHDLIHPVDVTVSGVRNRIDVNSGKKWLFNHTSGFRFCYVF